MLLSEEADDVTVIEHDAETLLSSLLVAVITALPSETAVTVPSDDTVAIDSSDDDHDTVRSDAVSGEHVAVIDDVEPFSMDREVLLNDNELTSYMTVALLNSSI